MKHTLTLIAFVLLTSVIAKAQSGWIDHKIDNHISIKFPAKPAELIPGTIGVLSADSVACGITVIDLNKAANIDSATLASIKESPEFAEQLQSGMKETAKGIELQPLKLGTWHGLTSYTSAGTGGSNTQFKLLMVIYGATIYNLTSVTPGKSNSKTGELFFNSLTLTK